MSQQDRATTEQMDTIRSIMKEVRICMLTTVADDGALHSHPMTTQEAEFDGDCWFIASEGSDAVKHLQANRQVNVAYAGSSSWLSIAGRAEIVRDEAKKKELWNTFTEAWFTDGDTDPSVVLLHVDVDSAQYWDSPGRVATMVSMIKAKVTGQTPGVGESDSVDL